MVGERIPFFYNTSVHMINKNSQELEASSGIRAMFLIKSGDYARG